jgi:hypothetical protein
MFRYCSALTAGTPRTTDTNGRGVKVVWQARLAAAVTAPEQP